MGGGGIQMLLETNELYLNHPKTLKFIESRYTHCAMRLVFIGKCSHRTGNS